MVHISPDVYVAVKVWKQQKGIQYLQDALDIALRAGMAHLDGRELDPKHPGVRKFIEIAEKKRKKRPRRRPRTRDTAPAESSEKSPEKVPK